ncbi:MAG: type II secretion system protein [Synergistaceae bacterium]|nr:type II secretion system protein [Synergistaceae bacterium]MBQ7170536.1 type II secretion system protein [Synergistaceae bacterium]
MKRTRKGFTLVELLIVIGIVGILGAMGLIAGQEATSAARATVIADNLEKLAAAAMMFYEENSTQIDKDGTLDGTTAIDATALAAGINAYLKDANAIGSSATANTYFADVDGSGAAITWWVGYQFGDSDGNNQVRKAMANKATRMGLVTTKGGTTAYTASTTTGTGDEATTTANKTVYMKVR